MGAADAARWLRCYSLLWMGVGPKRQRRLRREEGLRLVPSVLESGAGACSQSRPTAAAAAGKGEPGA